MRPSRARPQRLSPTELADRLHSAAIHLLRAVRREDAASDLTGPRLSAMSVVVFAGPVTLGQLAAAEQVRPPTMTRLVNALEAEGLVVRQADPADARVTRIRPTARGRALLEAGRARRVAALAQPLSQVSADDRALLGRAAELIETIATKSAGVPQLRARSPQG